MNPHQKNHLISDDKSGIILPVYLLSAYQTMSARAEKPSPLYDSMPKVRFMPTRKHTRTPFPTPPTDLFVLDHWTPVLCALTDFFVWVKSRGQILSVMTHLFMWDKEQGSDFKRDDPPLHVGKEQGSDFKRERTGVRV